MMTPSTPSPCSESLGSRHGILDRASTTAVPKVRVSFGLDRVWVDAEHPAAIGPQQLHRR